jgi:hypothetical protein
MGTLIFLLILFIALIVAAWYLGFDSTECINSGEWKRRENSSTGVRSPHY